MFSNKFIRTFRFLHRIRNPSTKKLLVFLYSSDRRTNLSLDRTRRSVFIRDETNDFEIRVSTHVT